jgi:arginase
VLAARGTSAQVESATLDGPFSDTAASSADVNRRLAALVGRAIGRGHLPVVLAASCNASLGVLAGFEHSRCGAVWLDAHADFNTPETTQSGFFAGMSAAIATGACYRDYWGAIGDNTPIAEERIAMFGVRELSPAAERERLERSAIEVVEWRDGRPQGDVNTVLASLAERARDVYLHIDFDAFAPEVAPGIADEPVPGGLTLEDAEVIVSTTVEHFRIRAATLATFSPQRDVGDKTLAVGLRLLELLGDYAASHG